MTAASSQFHEKEENLTERTRNMHRALVSLMEELEAVDWYQQRAEACSDEPLAEILVHNKNEEIEHAMMTLEWIRRQDEVFDRMIATYLNTEGSIVDLEHEDADATDDPPKKGLGLGNLRRGSGEVGPDGGRS